MLPTFSVDGDWIAADMRYRLGRGIKVGDLVLYKIPIFTKEHGVKRVIGMPGDYVTLGTPGEPGEEQMIQVRKSMFLIPTLRDPLPRNPNTLFHSLCLYL